MLCVVLTGKTAWGSIFKIRSNVAGSYLHTLQSAAYSSINKGRGGSSVEARQHKGNNGEIIGYRVTIGM